MEMNNMNIDDANKKMKIIIIVAAVVITIMIVLFAWMYSSQSEKIEHAQTTVAELQNTNEQLKLENEQIQLDNEFQSLENQFQSIETQSKSVRGVVNDSISKEYKKAKKRIEELRKELKNEKNKSAKRIKELQGEIETLKGILRHYVAQIDSLSKENKNLREENTQIKNQNTELSSRVERVSGEKKVLEEKMVLAEKLNVTGVSFSALNKKGKNEKNITKAKQLKVTFTIPQNNSTPVGVKNLYLRITSPEGTLLGGAGTFNFEGANLQCTARKQIEYGGEEIGGITIYWDVNTALNPGEYLVELFTDGYRLTSRRYTMKK